MTPEEDKKSRQRPRASGHAGTVIWAAAAIVVTLLLWKLSDALLLLFAAIILAIALRGLSSPLERRCGFSPAAGVAVAVTAVLLVIGLGIWLMGARLAEQMDDLRAQLPEAIAATTSWLREHAIGRAMLESLDGAGEGDLPWSTVASAAGQTVGAIASAGLVAVLGIYLAADPRTYTEGVIKLLPPRSRRRGRGALAASGHSLRRWLLGQSISMLFVGVSTAAGLALLGVPLALSIGLLAGALAFVPFFGPIASGLVAVIFAFVQGPMEALHVALLCVGIQQVEGHLLMPFVQRWAVSLPPVLAVFASVAFGLIFGLPGVLLATPLMVVLISLIQKLYVERMGAGD